MIASSQIIFLPFLTCRFHSRSSYGELSVLDLICKYIKNSEAELAYEKMITVYML